MTENWIWIALMILISPWLLYLAAKMATLGVLRAKRFFEEEQNHLNNGRKQ